MSEYGELRGVGEITVTGTTATLAALLTAASITIDNSTRMLRLYMGGAVSIAYGAAAVNGVGLLAKGVVVPVPIPTSHTVPDLRLIASANTAVIVKQEA